MTTYEHDKEAGRQLAWGLVVVSALAVGAVVWLERSGETMPQSAPWIPAGLIVLTVLAFMKP
jgi:hypothetical protein